MRTLTTGQLAKEAGVNVETVRYYERRRLIPEPSRRESGYRQYPEHTVDRIRFIKRAQDLGFTLNEISELLSLRVDPETTCADVKEQTRAKIRETEEKLRSLQTMKRALTKLEAACTGQGPVGDCPILEALEDEGGW